MKIVNFVTETKENVIQQLSELAGPDACSRETIPFAIGQADVAIIRGGAIEKASITHLTLNQVKPPGVEEPIDYMVFQMEVFPENPFCPMGHFNTEWSLAGPGPYHMNLDLFPAVAVAEDLTRMRSAMDRVAEQFGLDKDQMRKGLDEHYNMDYWEVPLATMVGCKLLDLKDDQVDLFIAAYHTFFGNYLEILKNRKETPSTEDDQHTKLKRNGRWLEYITLKDPAVKMGLAAGIPAQVLLKLSYPPSAVF